MKLTFLGGADEVGASCTLLEIGGRRLLVDCGIRMGADDRLPWLSLVEEAGGLDAIILTHAHMDHTGALPVIHQSYPHIKVYMTASTLTLTTILLMDSLKIMKSELEQEGEIPLYPQIAVEMLLGASMPVPFGQSVDILDGDIRLTYYPAGHIMGAASVLVESDEGVIMMGGDVSVTDQKTIPGMIVPPLHAKPDIMVIESTYGGRLHANRSGEEMRIVERVREVIERKGSILFPAFAVGRAQEVILILTQAMEQKRLPRAPIFVDGMVRAICKAYTSYPDLLSPWLRKRVLKYGQPFFDPEGPVEPVWDPRKRLACARQRPSIIVSSSGMLTGGPSPVYAAELAKDPASFIAITGYQDEESPGRRLQEVARAGGGKLKLNGKEVTLQCGVGTYGLSAHADEQQIVNLVTGMKPRQVALVHGDKGARESLQAAIQRAGIADVHLPTLGSSIEVKGHARKRSRARHTNKATNVPPLQMEHLVDLAQLIVDRDSGGRFYTAQEILVAYGDYEGASNPQELERVSALFRDRGSPFKPDKKRPFLFRLRLGPKNVLQTSGRGASKGPKAKTKTKAPSGKLDPNNALKKVADHLTEEDGLYKKSTQLDTETIVLSFYFPKVAAQRHQQAVTQIAKDTGWTVTLRESPHQQALLKAATEMLPEGWTMRKGPSLHLQDEKITINLDTPPQDIESAQAVMQAYFDRTGFRLEWKGATIPQPEAIRDALGLPSMSATPPTGPTPPSHAPTPSALSTAPPTATAAASASTTITPDTPVGVLAQRFPPAPGPLEINASYNAIRQAFADQPHELIKIGNKNDVLEAAFVSPQIGERYQMLLQALSAHVGRPIRIRPSPDQNRIINQAKALLPESWGIKKLGIHVDQAKVIVQLNTTPDDASRTPIVQAFQEATGYTLAFKTPSS